MMYYFNKYLIYVTILTNNLNNILVINKHKKYQKNKFHKVIQMNIIITLKVLKNKMKKNILKKI